MYGTYVSSLSGHISEIILTKYPEAHIVLTWVRSEIWSNFEVSKLSYYWHNRHDITIISQGPKSSDIYIFDVTVRTGCYQIYDNHFLISLWDNQLLIYMMSHLWLTCDVMVASRDLTSLLGLSEIWTSNFQTLCRCLKPDKTYLLLKCLPVTRIRLFSYAAWYTN
jgi:hypothetical protein